MNRHELKAPARETTVIVCTLGRMETLPDCIESIRRQDPQPGEILVVLGPDSQPARRWLAGQDDIRLARIEHRNLSASRNVGIQAAKGRFVAFLDDDATACDNWLADLLASIQRQDVAAVGGQIARPDDTLEFKRGLVRLSGKRLPVRPEGSDEIGTGWYPTVGGGNCLYRREALEQIGFFDEFIEFSYDETDVCMRLLAAGWKIAHARPGLVIHHSQPGGFRLDCLRRNWFVEIKNQLYFSLGHRAGPLGAFPGILRAGGRIWKLRCRLLVARLRGQVARSEAREMLKHARRGFRAGLSAGLARRRHFPPRSGHL